MVHYRPHVCTCYLSSLSLSVILVVLILLPMLHLYAHSTQRCTSHPASNTQDVAPIRSTHLTLHISPCCDPAICRVYTLHWLILRSSVAPARRRYVHFLPYRCGATFIATLSRPLQLWSALHDSTACARLCMKKSYKFSSRNA
jgi:hypothetical protein